MYKKIKRLSLLSLLALLPLLIAQCGAKQKVRIEYTQDIIQPLGYCIVEKNGKPADALVELLHITTQELRNIPCKQLTLQKIVDTTQREWLRKPGTERWNVQEKSDLDRECIVGLLDQLCLFKEINPRKDHYTYCFIFGATAKSVRARLAHMLRLWKAGVRFDTLIFLGGARPLDGEQESASVLLDRTQCVLPIRCNWTQTSPLPTTETEMMKFIFSQIELPEDFTQINIQFIDTPMQKKDDGSLRRPNTGDTIAEWLATDPMLGSCLFVSNQPYVGYQDAVARTYMPSSFEIDTVGACTTGDKQNIDVVLDNLARWLYQENIRRKSK